MVRKWSSASKIVQVPCAEHNYQGTNSDQRFPSSGHISNLLRKLGSQADENGSESESESESEMRARLTLTLTLTSTLTFNKLLALHILRI